MLVSSGLNVSKFIKPGGGLAREVIHFMSSVQFLGSKIVENNFHRWVKFYNI